ncbi:MAG: hypothetical protein B6D39_01155 [Anaerolineae bacterium UTCFX2]|jgi:hypothetical protein|nr:DUF3467 domain-containing protein [Anaerolineales bacterium]OQY94687.1 MAG: hypothetical protein B6D39_01155 [Anaerolineae bacterium UTCFX2]
MSENPVPNPRPNPPGLELPPDLPVEYANLVRIAHSPSDLVFDFAHLLPGARTAQISSRIIMSPLGAKLFHRALSENLARYEAAFSEIVLPGNTSLADNLFQSLNPDDKS